jgi:hypothetical protein
MHELYCNVASKNAPRSTTLQAVSGLPHRAMVLSFGTFHDVTDVTVDFRAQHQLYPVVGHSYELDIFNLL